MFKHATRKFNHHVYSSNLLQRRLRWSTDLGRQSETCLLGRPIRPDSKSINPPPIQLVRICNSSSMSNTPLANSTTTFTAPTGSSVVSGGPHFRINHSQVFSIFKTSPNRIDVKHVEPKVGYVHKRRNCSTVKAQLSTSAAKRLPGHESSLLRSTTS